MAYTYKLTNAIFSDSTTIEFGNLVVIVGPNNCGKSRALREVIELATHQETSTKVVEHLEFSLPSDTRELQDSYSFLIDEEGEVGYLGYLDPDLRRFQRRHIGSLKWAWTDGIQGVIDNPRAFGQHFSPQLLLLLKAETRLTLVSRAPGLKNLRETTNILQVLYKRGSVATRDVSEIVSTAFPGTQLALDFTVPQNLEFRVGADFSKVPVDPRDALPKMSKFERLDDQGDGLRAFVGLVAAVKAMDRPVVMVDEPESFLHPPQAFQMGCFLAKEARDGRQIILATHSPDILRGVLFENRESSILRIDRTGNINTVRHLSKSDLTSVVSDPLLSAAGVLSGLFYPSVVVTEGDADSRLYQALSSKANIGLDTHYINANGKQTIPKIMETYKRLGVRCAGIVDIDVLNDGAEFRAQLEAAGIAGDAFDRAFKAAAAIDESVRKVPPAERLKSSGKAIEELRFEVERALAGDPKEQTAMLSRLGRELARIRAESSPWNAVKKDATTALKDCQPQFAEVYRICRNAGLFINPCGELEALLTECGMPWLDNKREWITRALQFVANLQCKPENYPWKFILDVHAYLEQPAAAPASTGEISVIEPKS